MKIPALLALALAPTLTLSLAPGDDHEKALTEAVATFSATMHEGGDGWEAYADFLHPAFTRWTLEPGGTILSRDELVDGAKTWWEQGSCVGESQVEVVSQEVEGNVGIVRRRVNETYLGRDGEVQGKSRNLVTQVWLREKETWLLWAMDVMPLPSKSG